MTVKRVLHFPDGTIDEVVGDGCFHLERMEEDLYWIGLEGPSGEQIALWIAADSPIRVTGGINGEESGAWPSGVEVERHC